MNDYHLLNQIGEGSFGRVYRARRKYTGRLVAIKMINKLGQAKEDLQSFRSEIEILRRVDHPNIMKFLDIFETDTDFCLVTEFARGDLFQIIDDNQTLPEDVLKIISAQLLSSLDYLHKNNIIHRDIKPQNVLIGAGSSLKLCDFGFARALSNTTLVLTSIKGTPLYMAPELVQEHEYNEKVDIWSLGVILYELYFGKPPFFTNSIYKLIQMIVSEPIMWTGVISEQFKDFLLSMLQKDPCNRWSCEALLKHPFVDGVVMEDDEQYKFKQSQFDEAIKEGLNPLSSGDFQSVLLNPSAYTTEDLLMAFKHIRESETPLSDTFAFHFADFIKNSSVLDDALKVATELLQQNKYNYLDSLSFGATILSYNNFPQSAIGFWIELLVIPSIKARLSGQKRDVDISLSAEAAEKLRDRLTSFIFSSDQLQLPTYALIAHLAGTCDDFLAALTGHSASQLVPIATSAAMHNSHPVIRSSAFSILSKVTRANPNTLQFIQPLSEFVETLMILSSPPTDLASMCLYTSVLEFLEINYSTISQSADFQKVSKASTIEAFIASILMSRETVFKALLRFAQQAPLTREEYLAYNTTVKSPFAFFPLSETLISEACTAISSLLPIHTYHLTLALMKQPASFLTDVMSSMLNYMFQDYTCSICQQLLEIFLLDMNEASKKASLMCSNGVLGILAKYIDPDKPKQPLLDLCVAIVLLNTTFRKEDTPGLVDLLISSQETAEAAAIVGSHIAYHQPCLLEGTNSLSFFVHMLSYPNTMIRQSALSFFGHWLRYTTLSEEIINQIVPRVMEEMNTDVNYEKALYALGNILYRSPNVNIIDFDQYVLDGDNPILIDHSIAIISNSIRNNEAYLLSYIKSGIIDKCFDLVTQGNGSVFLKLLVMCKYEDGKKYLKNKRIRALVAKLTKHFDEVVRINAQRMLSFIDS